MVQLLTLGKLSCVHNIIQGPLAGVSCAPFRRLMSVFTNPAFACTEMISAKTLIHKPEHAQRRFIEIAKDEGPVCFQLSSSDPFELAKATRRVTQYGAGLIDLNCGCPVKKIRAKGAGSKLLSKPALLADLISAMKDNTDVPVSIKIRSDGGSQDRFNQEIAEVVSRSNLDFLVVHGRHWTEHYETDCDYEQVRYFVNALDLPVIGNGDIACLDSLKKMQATGCAGVMIGRAGVGQPWLIEELLARSAGKEYKLPPAGVMRDLFLSHVEALVRLLQSEKFAVLQARKLVKYYARHLRMRKALCDQVNICENFNELQKICAQFFLDQNLICAASILSS